MLEITGLQLLYKQEGFYDAIVGSKTKIQLIINQTDRYETTAEKPSDKLIRWPGNALPAIPVDESFQNFQLDFKFIKGNEVSGKAKSFIILGQNRKDCLDVITDHFESVGKFMYEGKWKNHSFQNQPFQNFAKRRRREEANQQYFELEEVRSQQSVIKKKKRVDRDQSFLAGLLSCCKKLRRPRKKKIVIKSFNVPVQYGEKQIKNAPDSFLQPEPINYYTKPIIAYSRQIM